MSKGAPNTIVFHDTEFTASEGALKSDWTEPGQYCELVQIGAMRLDLESIEEREGAPYGINGRINSGKLASVPGAPVKAIQEHNALRDARSIAAAYHFLNRKRAKSPFSLAQSPRHAAS
jgi:hypothetical protein